MSATLLTPASCDSLVTQIDREIAQRHAAYDEIALAAVADPAAAADRDRLRRELETLTAQRDDALAAQRAAAKHAARQRAHAEQRSREEACAHAERAASDALERAVELEIILARAMELFTEIREAELAWNVVVAGAIGAHAFTRVGPVLSMTAEIQRVSDALSDDVGDIARLGERATSRAAALTGTAASVLTSPLQESE